MSSIGLTFYTFTKIAANFPAVIRANDFGFNFLAHRNAVWQIIIVGIILIFLNAFLTRYLKNDSSKTDSEAGDEASDKAENLRSLLFFANMVVAVLVLLISIQIYFLNS